MQIPKRFKLLGHTVEVSEDQTRYYERGAFGSCNYEAHWIKLVPPHSGHHPITQSSYEQTFWHEVIHMMLHQTEQCQLNENEKFVDLMAALLQQVMSTMEFE